MADVKDVTRTKSGRLTYRGESFPGYNKQVRTSGGKKKFKVWEHLMKYFLMIFH